MWPREQVQLHAMTIYDLARGAGCDAIFALTLFTEVAYNLLCGWHIFVFKMDSVRHSEA
jgi:hypothetical protein